MTSGRSVGAELDPRQLTVVADNGMARTPSALRPPAGGMPPGFDDASSRTVIAESARSLLGRVPQLADRLVDVIVASEPAYARSSVVALDDLRQSCHDNLARILEGLINHGRTRPHMFDAPRLTGDRRAQQGFPLEHLLRAFRLAGRVIWESIVEQVSAAGVVDVDQLVRGAGHIWEILDIFSAEVGDSYRQTEARMARRDDGRRRSMIDALIKGAGHDRTVVQAAAAILDMPESKRCVVVVAEHRAGDAHGLRRPGDALALLGVRSAWRVRADREVGILSMGPCSLDQVLVELGPRATGRVGVSPVVEGLRHVDVAFRLAEIALRTIPPGRTEVARLEGRRWRRALVVEAAEVSVRLAEEVLGPVLALPEREREVLLRTMDVFLAEGGSALRAAQGLRCHRNTVLNRLHRVETLTGRSMARPEDVSDLILALDAARLLTVPSSGAPARPARAGGHGLGARPIGS